MDAKMIEMNNLRVLNDYLTQCLDVLSRQARAGQPGSPTGFGFSPFAPIPTPATMGTDTVYGPWHTPAAQYSPFGTSSPLTGLPFQGAGYGGVDPFLAQRSYSPSTFAPIGFGPSTFAPMGFGQSPFYGTWQQPWSPVHEAQRQAQVNQALVARQSVLESMCRACGIPV